MKEPYLEIGSGLTFVENSHDIHFGDDVLLAWIPQTITDQQALFQFLSKQLHFPEYFGYNWDALSDMLRDLSWVSTRRVAIAHDGLPSLEEAALRMYIETLMNSVEDWKPGDAHELLALFPLSCKNLVQDILEI